MNRRWFLTLGTFAAGGRSRIGRRPSTGTRVVFGA